MNIQGFSKTWELPKISFPAWHYIVQKQMNWGTFILMDVSICPCAAYGRAGQHLRIWRPQNALETATYMHIKSIQWQILWEIRSEWWWKSHSTFIFVVRCIFISKWLSMQLFNGGLIKSPQKTFFVGPRAGCVLHFAHPWIMLSYLNSLIINMLCPWWNSPPIV